MSNPERPIFIKHCARDAADLHHDYGTGRLILVTREPRKIGCTIKDMDKFRASLAENNPPLESWPAFLAGLAVGAATAFTVTAIIGYCVWRIA